MQIGKSEIGTMKLRTKYFQKGYPVQLTYPTLKIKITWDENGTADVPSNIARKLLNKDEYGDGYELVGDQVKEEKKTSIPGKRSSKVIEETPKEELKEESEFLNTITG